MPEIHQQEPPARLLALDLGERRIGVAVSDELGMFAHPRAALHITSDAQAIEAIIALVSSEAVGEVVVGLPLNLEGLAAAQATRIRPVINALRRRLPIPVLEWDERFSSAEAGRQVKGKRQRTGELDSAAAAVILQSVIDSRRGAPR